jgi:hypothetical protein
VLDREGPPKQRVLTWRDVDMLIDHLLPQLNGPYGALVMITRGGIIPGGLIGEALDVRQILTASVRFSTDLDSAARMFAWPESKQPVDGPSWRSCTTNPPNPSLPSCAPITLPPSPTSTLSTPGRSIGTSRDYACAHPNCKTTEGGSDLLWG